MSDGAINTPCVPVRAGVVTRPSRGTYEEALGGEEKTWEAAGMGMPGAVCLVCLFAEEPCGGYSLIERFRSSVRNE